VGRVNPPDHAFDGPDRQVPSRFQVLALDGGGLKGIFSAAVLAGLEQDLGGRPIVQHFDLVTGTSTGGIIALALGAGMSPRQVLQFYLDQQHQIFPNRFGHRSLRQLFAAKYSSRNLQAALRRAFGETLLGHSRVPLVIPTYNLGDDDVYLFKTPHVQRLRRDWRVPMWQVAMATSAAPTYFPAFCLPSDRVRLIDGGVWANNPALVGVTEAVSLFKVPLDRIRVLSLGTTSAVTVRKRRLDRGGLLQWARGATVVDVLLRGQSTGAHTQVAHLLGADQVLRLNPPVPPGLSRLDAVDADELIGKASHHSRKASPQFEARFADHLAAPYHPHHVQTTER
jgi:patatin-like phospholipase/acyl hydrolase